VTVTAGGANPNYDAAKKDDSGLGPYDGLAQIVLLAVNPGPAGKAKVKIDGTLKNTPFQQTVDSPPRNVVTTPGGTLNILDSQGKLLLTGSLNPYDPNAIPQSINGISADSYCTGQQAAFSCGVAIGISLGEALIGAPTPATFSVTLNIQFVNQ
jgi:hypothetical protein